MGNSCRIGYTLCCCLYHHGNSHHYGWHGSILGRQGSFTAHRKHVVAPSDDGTHVTSSSFEGTRDAVLLGGIAPSLLTFAF
jgi:hypothetical protein